MRRSASLILSFIRDFSRAQRGVTAVTVAVLTPIIIASAGLAIDVGHVFQVDRALQAATDAAALAGAEEIECCTTAVSTATAYSATASNMNAIPGVTVTMVSGFPLLKCFTSTGVSCSNPSSANGIQVAQQATVPLWFARVLGLPSITISATSTAGASGGVAAKPLDIMLVVDSTKSMTDPDADASCGVAEADATAEDCALAGVRALLQNLSPSADYVGLMTFPGLKSTTDAASDFCGTGGTKIEPAPYGSSPAPIYLIVPLSNDYKTSSTTTTLNTSSDLVKAIGGDTGGSKGCAGLQVVGGEGTYYAELITIAQSTLVSTGRANTQKVIVIASDGGANAKAPSEITTALGANECQAAIAAARAATAAGTWVYSLSFDSSTLTGSSSTCTTDTSNLSPVNMEGLSGCETMTNMASNPSFFYSDGGTGEGGTGCPSSVNKIGEIVNLYQNLSTVFTTASPRLLSNNTT